MTTLAEQAVRHANVFTPIQVGRYELPNRVFMAPMTRCRATPPGNVANDLMATYYGQRASAGLIVTEATQVSQQGQGYPNTPGIYSAEQVAGWRKVTEAVHARGGRIFAQLWHVGRISHPVFQPDHAAPVAPSAIAARGQVFTGTGMEPYPTPRALETDEIPAIVDQFARAAANAEAAGFDGVELHGANGYLIDQFLRDGTNHRTDAYGGSVENRARFLLEVTRAVVDVLGADRVAVRLSPSGVYNDMFDSNPRATFGYAVEQLDTLGLAYLHITEAQEADKRHAPAGYEPIPVSYFRPLFRGPLVTNGGYTLDRANEVIAQGSADAVSFGAPFIANPDLVERFRRGAPLATPDAATFYSGGAKGYTDYPALT